LLHRFLAWRNTVDSEATLRFCDLVLVPNEDERAELQKGPPLRAQILVEPYALADNFREALTRGAMPAAERLSRQTVCFIGMWSPRKGSLDWSKIIAAIRERYPAAAFHFLGTMYDDEVIFADLDVEEGIFCRKTFSEEELPSLLSDCTVGLFPSYIEGFGLAVLEQLAAGLPTIAYDVSGPRQILAPLRDRLLVPAGDITQLAARACGIFAASVSDYERLSKDCMTIASKYRWSEVAARTIEAYRAYLVSLG
jgi:glycosyltransferase involved in cell wall biosynthesis